jgi:hypothetical protein
VRQVDRRIDDYLADANLSRQLDALIAAAADYDADMERLLDDVRDEVDGVDCL